MTPILVKMSKLMSTFKLKLKCQILHQILKMYNIYDIHNNIFTKWCHNCTNSIINLFFKIVLPNVKNTSCRSSISSKIGISDY